MSQYEYLGMLLDNKLNLNHHVDNMYKKVNSRLGILSEIRKFIFDVTASRIDKTMIQPHLEYINFVIASCRKDRIKKLNKLQHRALRRIEYCMNPMDRLY